MSIAHGSLTVQTTIAIAAEMLACLAMGSVIAASIRGRWFEFGVLRAIGAQRRTVVLLILGEALVLGLAAATVGTLAGLYLAYIDTQNLKFLAGLPLRVRMPVLPIAIGWCLLLVMTALAALPAAARLVRNAPALLVAAGQNE